MITREEFEQQRAAESKDLIDQARAALTKLQPGAQVTVMTQEAAGRIQQVMQILPHFPAVMLAETKDKRRVYMCREGKGTYILFLKTKMGDTGKPYIQWAKSQLKAIDIVLYGFPEPTEYKDYIEAPRKGIYHQ